MTGTRSDDSKTNSLVQSFVRQCDQITFFRTAFEKIPRANYTKGMLTSRKEGLDTTWGDVKRAHDKLYLEGAEVDSDTLLSCSQKFQLAQEDYYNLVGNILDEIDQIEKFSETNSMNNIPTDRTQTTPLMNFRLPPIVIPKFCGQYEMWRSFRDIFSSVIINNSKLSSVEKFYYLISNVENRPKDLISKFSMESASFEIAWKILVKEYENKRVLVHSQLNLLFAIQPAKSENPVSIRLLQDTINDCLSSLKNLDVSTENWDPILIYLATQKLPNLTHALWESKLEGSTDLERWEDMNNFLYARFRTLEALSEKKNSNSSANFNSKPNESHNRVKSFHTQSNNSCIHCSESSHSLYSCPKFHKLDPKKRFDFAKAKKLCINCLGSHKLLQCTSKNLCQKCGKKHHSLLHFNNDFSHSKVPDIASTSQSKFNNNATSSYNGPPQNENSSFPNTQIPNKVISNLATSSRRVLLATALVQVKVNNQFHTLRCLIDQGSETSFILKSVIQSLRIPQKPCSAQVSGIGYSLVSSSNTYASLELYPLHNYNNHISFDALVLKKISGILPSQEIPTSELSGFGGIHLADPTYFKPGEIHLLLGADIFSKIILSNTHKFNNFVAQETIFGYMLSGSMVGKFSGENSNIKVLSYCNKVSLNQTLEKFWQLEEIPNIPLPSSDDIHCEKHFLDTHYRRADGRFVVELPFVKEYPIQSNLSSSRDIAFKRNISTLKTLSKNDVFSKMYDDVMQEYVDLGHMSPCESKEKISWIDQNRPIFESYYLPHHGVYKAQSLSTKLRVVFDASCKTSNGKSLNDVLYCGPPLQSKIIDILNRVRLFPYIYNCDIKMMYRQIALADKHTDFHRLLFKNSNGSIQDYKMLTVTFGVSSSPYLAMRCLKQLAITGKEEYPLASQFLEESTNVDDIFAGFYDLATAKKSQIELIALLKSAGFELRKWTANNPHLLQKIPLEYHANPNLHDDTETTLLKTLGILFDNKHDFYTFGPQQPVLNYPLTKRKVFSEIAKLYDPAGWLAPIIIIPKILLQDVWKDGTDWDECISEERILQWETFVKSISKIEDIQILRWFKYLPGSRVEVHGFCDASIKAYAACIYFRAYYKNQLFLP